MKLNTKNAIYIHLVGSIAFFLPHFLFGDILIASTDLTDSITPIIFDQLRVALSGEIPLWNEYQYGGVPYGIYPNAHYLLPENLLLFALFPEKYFFTANTFVSFLKFFLTGVFAFFTFARILRNRSWALFASLTYQFGLYTFWQLTVFDTYSIWLYLTISLYLVYTVEERGPLANFLLCFLIFWQVMMPNHLVTVVYAVGLIAIVAFIRLLAEPKLPLKAYFVPLLAFLVAFSFFNVRLLFVIQDFIGSNRDASQPYVTASHIILSTRLFVPELFGFNFRNHPLTIQSLGHIFNGLHLQWAAPHFFGTLPIILLIGGALFPGRFRLRYWNLLSLLLVAFFFLVYPIGMFFLLGAGNLAHHLGLAILLPFPVCVASAATGMHFFGRRRDPSFAILSPVTRGLAWLVVLSGITIIIWRHPAEEQLYVRLGMIGLAGFLVLRALYQRSPDNPIARVDGAIRTKLSAFAPFLPALLALVAVNEMRLMQEPITDAMLFNGTLLCLLVVTLSLIVYFLRSERSLSGGRKYAIVLPAILIGLSFIFYPGHLEPVDQSLRPISLLGMIGLLRFVCIAWILIELIRLVPGQRLAGALVVLILLGVHSLDLAASLRIHSQIGLQPFFPYTTIVPPARELLPEEFPNRSQFRVNGANTMLGLPYYRELYGETEIKAGVFQFYNFRSGGGYYNAISPRYSNLLTAVTTEGNREDAITHATNVRSPAGRKLLGVKYTYRGDGVFKIEEQVLPRFSFFDNIRTVAGSNDSLETVKAWSADPASAPVDLMRTLVIESESESASESTGTIRLPPSPSAPAPAARGLEYSRTSNTTYRLRFITDRPGFVLWNESFNAGWRAYANGESKRIYNAHHAFMAVPVAAGESVLEFKYEPPVLARGRLVAYGAAAFGLLVLIALGVLQYAGNRIAYKAEKASRWKFRQRKAVLRSTALALFLLALVSGLHSVFNYRNGLPEGPREWSFRDYNIFPDEAVAFKASSEFPGYEAGRLLRGERPWASVPLTRYPQWLEFNTKQARRPLVLKLKLAKQHPERGPASFHIEGWTGNNWEKIPGRYGRPALNDEWQSFALYARRAYDRFRLVFTEPLNPGPEPLMLQNFQLW